MFILPGLDIQIQDGTGKHAVFLILVLNLLGQFTDDMTIRLAEPHGFGTGFTPLHPAPGIGDGPFFFDGGTAGQEKDLCLDFIGFHARTAPEGPRFVVKDIDVDHPVQLAHSLSGLVGIGTTAGGILSPGKKAPELFLVHGIKKLEPGIGFSGIGLGQPGIGDILIGLGVHGPKQADRILGIVLPPVGALGIIAMRRIRIVVCLERRQMRLGNLEVARDDMPQQTMVRGALNIGLTAQGIDSTTGHTNVSEEQLDHGHGTDILDTHGMLGPAHGIHDSRGLVGRSRSRIGLIDLKDLIFGSTCYIGNFVDIVTFVMLFQKLKYTTLMLQAGIFLGIPVFVSFKSPVGFVIFATVVTARLAFLISGKKAILELEFLADNKGGIGIVDHVLLEIQLVIKDIFDHSAQKSDIGPAPEGGINIRLGGCLGEPGIYIDECSPVFFGLINPLERNGMIGCRITAHNQNDVTVLEINPVVGHCTASERLCQSRNSCAVSNTCLVLNPDQAKGSQE